ncbi:hypothetical protein STEG23_002136 [Scotinomys teguina]
MQPGQTTNSAGGTMEVVAAAPRCQLLLILLMAVMLLPGTNGSLLLVQRTVTRTIVLQETIGKEKNICGSERQTTEEEKEKRKKKCLQGTRTTTKSDFEIFKRMTGSLNDDSTWTKVNVIRNDRVWLLYLKPNLITAQDARRSWTLQDSSVDKDFLYKPKEQSSVPGSCIPEKGNLVLLDNFLLLWAKYLTEKELSEKGCILTHSFKKTYDYSWPNELG